jgi:hypothetical protein
MMLSPKLTELGLVGWSGWSAVFLQGYAYFNFIYKRI